MMIQCHGRQNFRYDHESEAEINEWELELEYSDSSYKDAWGRKHTK